MLWILSHFWPFLLPLAIAIFVIFADEHIWKKAGFLTLIAIVSSLMIFTSNVYVDIFGCLGVIVLLIVLLIYYRNRGVV